MHEYTHGHIQSGKQVPDFFLVIRRPVHHSIVFNSQESLVVAIADLIAEILTRAVFKHAVMKSIIQFERFAGLICRQIFLSQQSERRYHRATSNNTLLYKISSSHIL